MAQDDAVGDLSALPNYNSSADVTFSYLTLVANLDVRADDAIETYLLNLCRQPLVVRLFADLVCINLGSVFF